MWTILAGGQGTFYVNPSSRNMTCPHFVTSKDLNHTYAVENRVYSKLHNIKSEQLHYDFVTGKTPALLNI